MVEVKPYFSALEGTASLGEFEQEIVSRDNDSKVVLVEVEKVEGLVEAYPNYFGDVTLFIQNLKSICEGKSAIEYNMAPREVVAPKPEEVGDPSWLIPRRHRRWTEERRISASRNRK